MHTHRAAPAENLGGLSRGARLRLRLESVDALRLADVGLAVYLIAFLLLPLAIILGESLMLIARGGLGDLPGFLEYLARLTTNSLILAGTVTVVCVAVSIPLAVLTARVLSPGPWLALALTLPLLAPPFVSSFATIILFGRVGVFTQLLQRVGIQVPEIYGFPGIALTHILHLVPLAYLTILAGLRAVPRAVEESAISLGSSPLQVIRLIVLPYISSYVYMAALLVFLASFGDVGAPLLVGGQFLVLPTEAFTRFISFTSDQRVPILLSSWIVLISVVIMVGVRRLMQQTSIAHTFTVSTYRYDVPGWRLPGAVASWCVAIGLFVPYIVILVSSFATIWGPDLLPKALTLDHYGALWRSVGPLRNSLIVSAAATPVAVFLAIVVGRQIRLGGRSGGVLDYVTLLPFVISGVVLGIGLVKLYSPLEAAGVPLPFLSGPGLLIIAMVSRRISYPVRVLSAGFTRIDRSLEECSLSLGASPARTFVRITLPQLYAAILAAATITFIEVIKELGATLIVYRPGWATLPVQIYAYAIEGNLGRAGAVSMLLLAIVVVGTAAVHALAGGRAPKEASS